MQHHAWFETEGFENIVPLRKGNSQGIFNGKGDALKIRIIDWLLSLNRS